MKSFNNFLNESTKPKLVVDRTGKFSISGNRQHIFTVKGMDIRLDSEWFGRDFSDEVYLGYESPTKRALSQLDPRDKTIFAVRVMKLALEDIDSLHKDDAPHIITLPVIVGADDSVVGKERSKIIKKLMTKFGYKYKTKLGKYKNVVNLERQ